MKQVKLGNGFPNLSDAELLVRAQTIHAAMSGQPTVFADPVPTLGSLLTLINAFEQAILTSDGGIQATAAKNQIRENLIDTLHLLGNYVLVVAAGDIVIATSSGYRLTKTPAPRPAVTAPEGMILKNGIPKGELVLKFQRVIGATGYIYEITPSPITDASVWTANMDTITKMTFSNLESGTEYNVRVAAIGIRGQKVYSGIATLIAL